jgi:glutamate dehydrogenase
LSSHLFEMATETQTETETDTTLSVFPTYVDPFDEIFANMDEFKAGNKYVEQIIRSPGREPSPQPTHFSVSSYSHPYGHNGHRVLRSATVGYIAPRFEGKKAQMREGQYCVIIKL